MKTAVIAIMLAIFFLLAGCGTKEPMFIQKNYTGLAHEVFLFLNASPELPMSEAYLNPEFAEVNESKTLFVGIQNINEERLYGTLSIDFQGCLPDEGVNISVQNSEFTFPNRTVSIYPEEIQVINFTIDFLEQGKESKCNYQLRLLDPSATYAYTGFQVYNQLEE